MADPSDANVSSTLVLTPDGNGDVTISLQGLQVSQNGGAVPIASLKSTDTKPVTIQMDTPPSYFDPLVFAALAVPLVLTSLLGLLVVLRMIRDMDKTVDKLAQLLSEDGPTQKMSFSRVQAFIFTYVIAFGCLLIIARTGAFPTEIPDDLAILAGGSLATFVTSKAIQAQANAKNNAQSGQSQSGQQGG